MWKIVSFFCYTSKKFEGKKLNKKRCLPRKKAAGLATSTTAQITDSKKLAHRPSSEKEALHFCWFWEKRASVAANIL